MLILKKQLFESKEFNLKFVDFQKEFMIEEANEYSWFAKNADFIIFGDGTAMICAKQDEFQDTSDFNLYLLYEDKTVVPVKLSKFLSTFKKKKKKQDLEEKIVTQKNNQ